MDQLKTDILAFFYLRKDHVFSRWKEKIVENPDHLIQNAIEKNGQILFQTLLHAFTLPESEIDSYLMEHAKSSADLKNSQQQNLGTFIYHVNVAKREMLLELFQFEESWEKVEPYYVHFSEIIDRFSMYVINHYIELKDQKRLYLHEQHEDRLTLLGQMTSSFVHEFRNPLTTVHGFIQLLRSENTNLPYLDIIASELDQLKMRITQFLTLSRKETFEKEEVEFSLNELLEQITSFIYPRLLETNVVLDLNILEELTISGYIEEIRQVIINIIFNAIDVLTNHDGSNVIKIVGYEEKGFIILKTSNTGPKIPNDLLETIFEPFYTTKKSGTGLGLSVCREIIEKHNGQLYCTSNEDWTIFTIILPSSTSEKQS